MAPMIFMLLINVVASERNDRSSMALHATANPSQLGPLVYQLRVQLNLVVPVGFEPTTYALSTHCSTG